MINDANEDVSAPIHDILETRGNRYGDFTKGAVLSQALRNAIIQHYYTVHNPATEALQPYQAEAIALICQKLSRIANGDPNYSDNWVDICGYAQLVVDELHKGQ